jgi:hypothetical protein
MNYYMHIQGQRASQASRFPQGEWDKLHRAAETYKHIFSNELRPPIKASTQERRSPLP